MYLLLFFIQTIRHLLIFEPRGKNILYAVNQQMTGDGLAKNELCCAILSPLLVCGTVAVVTRVGDTRESSSEDGRDQGNDAEHERTERVARDEPAANQRDRGHLLLPSGLVLRRLVACWHTEVLGHVLDEPQDRPHRRHEPTEGEGCLGRLDGRSHGRRREPLETEEEPREELLRPLVPHTRLDDLGHGFRRNGLVFLHGLRLGLHLVLQCLCERGEDSADREPDGGREFDEATERARVGRGQDEAVHREPHSEPCLPALEEALVGFEHLKHLAQDFRHQADADADLEGNGEVLVGGRHVLEDAHQLEGEGRGPLLRALQRFRQPVLVHLQDRVGVQEELRQNNAEHRSSQHADDLVGELAHPVGPQARTRAS